MSIRVVVPISGGRDSQSCLELALKQHFEHEIIGLFCDTQFEHPKTYEHVEWMRKHYGVHIEVRSGGSVQEKVLKHGRFPSFQARFCTEELKIREGKIFYRQLAENLGHGFEVWYGMRTGESHARRKKYGAMIDTELHPFHTIMPSKYPKYLEKMGVLMRLPIVSWSACEVMHFLNGRHNPLYDEGFDRVGCFPCLAAGDEYKEKAFKHDGFGAEQLIQVKQLEVETGKSIWTSKSGAARNSDTPCAICSI